jgi:hypothetical protein
MNTAPLISDLIDWSRASYTIRVREKNIYLWGSEGILENKMFSAPLLLHVHNDVFGEPITLSTEALPSSGTTKTQTSIGTLQPGECVSIPIQEMTGVFASCAVGSGPESTVSCLIKESK